MSEELRGIRIRVEVDTNKQTYALDIDAYEDFRAALVQAGYFIEDCVR